MEPALPEQAEHRGRRMGEGPELPPQQSEDEVFPGLELFGAVEDELAVLANGEPVARGVAASSLDGVNGAPDDDFVARIVAAAACVEWDVDAEGAWERVQQALELAADG